ncbi:hypothetical protein [Streptomyces sp. BPTC-684]|uniref:hypothetical protein n=1 Tax=Streptomyces sp. BPTC-684 TaxID=3043734 RepID=UPI0024B27E69|nr:hypothetical protein [Streptomyces sp. BPTC-684]WHM36316.1 hypothetical protein QIY60_04800 [Streptomyces sp. BPTC-684]
MSPVQVADFDAFFAEQGPAKRTGVPLRLFGREYRLPATVPALFTVQLHRVQHSARPEDILALLATLFGPDAADDFTARGMDDDQLGVLLIWATANTATPGCITIGEAAKQYQQREDAKGKAPSPRPIQNRSGRRSTGQGKRPSSGRRS